MNFIILYFIYISIKIKTYQYKNLYFTIKKVKIINFLLDFLKLFITINNENYHLPKASIWKRGFESNTADRYFIIFVLLNFVRKSLNL